MLAAFAVVAAGWVGSALILAHRRRVPFLWRRALLFLGGAFALGLVVGAWSLPDTRPTLVLLLHLIGG